MSARRPRSWAKPPRRYAPPGSRSRPSCRRPRSTSRAGSPRSGGLRVRRSRTLYDAARQAFPGVLIGGGMLSYFTELNRKRPPARHIDFVTHTTCPIVHDCDDRSVMETLEALPWVAETVRSFAAGKPYRVGPSMIGMRDNPYGAAPMPNPENRRIAMAINDPRQRGLFGAAWNLGYAARMAAAGVEALTLSAPLGAFGVVYAPTDFPQPWFDERRAGVYPLYHVLRGIAQAAGKPQLETTSSHPGAVQALAWQDDGGPVLWLANLTGQEQSVEIVGLPSGRARLTRLDLRALRRRHLRPGRSRPDGNVGSGRRARGPRGLRGGAPRNALADPT